jgi:Ca-activated chloride channel family protein
MIEVEYFMVFLLLPLPLLLKLLPDNGKANSIALQVPLFNHYGLPVRKRFMSINNLSRLVFWIVWVSVIVAASRPYWLGDSTHRRISGRDMILAMDVSGSMQEADMILEERLASRLAVLKSVSSKFIDRREGDRIGLILFGSKAYSYVPLTFDREALKVFLDDISAGLAGRLTAIGDAIAVSIKVLNEQASRHKVVILVTDGSNTSGESDPIKAARIAAHSGLTIYTIGVGNDEQTLNLLSSEQNFPKGTALNETLLKQVAGITGGRYFRARDTDGFEQITRMLDQLEPAQSDNRRYRPELELYQWPLGLAFITLFGFSGFRAFQSMNLNSG